MNWGKLYTVKPMQHIFACPVMQESIQLMLSAAAIIELCYASFVEIVQLMYIVWIIKYLFAKAVIKACMKHLPIIENELLRATGDALR